MIFKYQVFTFITPKFNIGIMNQLFISVVSGLVVIIIASFFGLGGSKNIRISGDRTRKTGKWIMIISAIVVFIGLSWAGKNPSGSGELAPGYSLALLGVFSFFIGKFIAWFQRN